MPRFELHLMAAPAAGSRIGAAGGEAGCLNAIVTKNSPSRGGGQMTTLGRRERRETGALGHRDFDAGERISTIALVIT